MKFKKLILIGILTVIIIFITIFVIINYKNNETGNNIINKSEAEIIDNILQIRNYRATLNISIESNKNNTQYIVKQKLQNKVSHQEVVEPVNIAGVTTEYDGNNLKIRNNKLELETIYENYQYIVDNNLWLNSFIEEYKLNQNKKVERNENEIILEVENKENIYNTNKKLYIDKKTGKPIKLIVQDNNKKDLIYILYSEIEISK